MLISQLLFYALHSSRATEIFFFIPEGPVQPLSSTSFKATFPLIGCLTKTEGLSSEWVGLLPSQPELWAWDDIRAILLYEGLKQSFWS